MKKILNYVLPVVAAMGMACGSMGCKSRPTQDVPAKVEISDVLFYQHEPDEIHTTCLYDGNSQFSGYFPSGDGGPNIGFMGFQIGIYDPNSIRNSGIAQWGDYLEDLSPTKDSELKERGELTVTMDIPAGSKLEKIPFKVKVTDGLGNVTEHKFALDEIAKKAKPYQVRKVMGECPEEL